MTQWSYNFIENLCHELFMTLHPCNCVEIISAPLALKENLYKFAIISLPTLTFVCILTSPLVLRQTVLTLNLYSLYSLMTVKTASFSGHASLCKVKVKWGENYQCKFWSAGGLKMNPYITAWGQVVPSVFRERHSPPLPNMVTTNLSSALRDVWLGYCTKKQPDIQGRAKGKW